MYMRSDTEKVANTHENCVSSRYERIYVFHTRPVRSSSTGLCSEEGPAALLYKYDLADDTEKFILKNKACGFRSYK
jgi:hypothetical protein